MAHYNSDAQDVINSLDPDKLVCPKCKRGLIRDEVFITYSKRKVYCGFCHHAFPNTDEVYKWMREKYKGRK